MIFGYFTLFVALLIETVGAYYSITGLAAIFSGAVVPILIMGGVLEIGKVTAAVWLKNNWNRASLQFKLYLLPAVTLLMIITSMGIFGFLSKAHNDQNLISGDVLGKIAIYDEKIKIQKDNIDSARRALQQMDAAVDQTMSRSTSEQGADKATAIRRSQARERNNLQKEISQSQAEIVKLNDQRAPIAAEVRKVEAEVGPLKYIAKMIYGDNPDANLLESAVVWVIIMIVAVFDPLALVLILAAQQSLRWARGEEKTKPKETVAIDQLTPNEIDRINALAAESAQTPEPEYSNYLSESAVETEPPVSKPKYNFAGFSFPMSSLVGNALKSKSKKKVKTKTVTVPTSITDNPNAPGLDAADERPGDYINRDEPIVVVNEPPLTLANKSFDNRPREAAPAPNRGVMFSQPVQADNAPKLGKASTTGFGNQFPTNPAKGDVFLRIDYLPNRLFKFNDKKWIEVDKRSTDVYAYEEQYIKHLIEQIDSGKYDVESLSDVEREQIKKYLGRNEQ